MNEIIIGNWRIIEAPENLEGYWVTGDELGNHLGYADPIKAVNNIYNRHAKCFKDNIDTSTLKLRGEAGARETRVFSERGALKVIRYSNTEQADEIMDEVFDVFIAAKKQDRIGDHIKNHPRVIEARQVLQLVEDYVRVEEEQKRLDEEQRRQAQQVRELQEKTRAVLDQSGYYSILAYANLMGQKITLSQSAQFGKLAKKLSIMNGITIGKIPDPRFGEVNTYHQSVLDELFGEFGGN